jgi:hypothetical protein
VTFLVGIFLAQPRTGRLGVTRENPVWESMDTICSSSWWIERKQDFRGKS